MSPPDEAHHSNSPAPIDLRFGFIKRYHEFFTLAFPDAVQPKFIFRLGAHTWEVICHQLITQHSNRFLHC